MDMVLSICLALSAAVLYGVSSVLQQAAAQRETDLPVVGLKVLRRLVHRPRWVLAVSIAGISFIVQAVALAFGPLVLVQPIAATDLLFALPLMAHMQRRHVGRRDWLASIMVVGGVSGFLAISPPSGGSLQPAIWTWALILGSISGLVAVAIALASGAQGARRAALLAGAGGLVFAALDALSKGVMDLVGSRGFATLLSWEPYALLVVGLTGMVLAQGAYRAGSLVTSLPIIDTVEPVGAVIIGTTAFSEHLSSSPTILAVQVCAGVFAVSGIIMLARSPLVTGRKKAIS